MTTDFKEQATGIAALADETRRGLYEYVVSQPEPVGRDAAAAALGLPRHQAKFHLDRLEEAGLLEADYVRLTGRTGPGAGRPAKVYRRTGREIRVSLPPRHYELAGDLMAQAIVASTTTGVPVSEALTAAAREHGRQMAADAPDGSPLEVAETTLGRHGYEPRVDRGCLTMANCPFHALMSEHPALVCGLNHDLLTGFCEGVGGLDAALEPAENRCCVVVRPD